ncbi:predicted 4-deoxy-L-threo-5-hexosulose-uronate ketol-isomerase [Enterobacter cloacae]|uniref:Predicted 4-deoxy-L-threo-5-hexosulose-uronate ketol-isomerase n=1 Tax=Enterobacter cloacae TaxID=550 RepID=A0A377LXA2_ENTCL|nr:predicted 4-deoxy-L-threo-5-hexosulose-uronate ketol-isomerase [Enterobacter cloacae]
MRDPESGESGCGQRELSGHAAAIDPELVKTAVSGQRFQQCFFENCQDKEIEAFVREIVG